MRFVLQVNGPWAATCLTILPHRGSTECRERRTPSWRTPLTTQCRVRLSPTDTRLLQTPVFLEYNTHRAILGSLFLPITVFTGSNSITPRPTLLPFSVPLEYLTCLRACLPVSNCFREPFSSYFFLERFATLGHSFVQCPNSMLNLSLPLPCVHFLQTEKYCS